MGESYRTSSIGDDVHLVEGNVYRFAADRLIDERYNVSLGLRFDEDSELEQFAYAMNGHPKQQAVIADRQEGDAFRVTRIYGDQHWGIRTLKERIDGDWSFLLSETDATLPFPQTLEDDYDTFLENLEEPLTLLTNLYDVNPDRFKDDRTVFYTTELVEHRMDAEPLTEDELLEEMDSRMKPVPTEDVQNIETVSTPEPATGPDTVNEQEATD